MLPHHSQTSEWYNESYTVYGPRGRDWYRRNDTFDSRPPPTQSSGTREDGSCSNSNGSKSRGSSIQWWDLYLSAVIAGVSAALTYHFVVQRHTTKQQQQRRRLEEEPPTNDLNQNRTLEKDQDPAATPRRSNSKSTMTTASKNSEKLTPSRWQLNNWRSIYNNVPTYWTCLSNTVYTFASQVVWVVPIYCIARNVAFSSSCTNTGFLWWGVSLVLSLGQPNDSNKNYQNKESHVPEDKKMPDASNDRKNENHDGRQIDTLKNALATTNHQASVEQEQSLQAATTVIVRDIPTDTKVGVVVGTAVSAATTAKIVPAPKGSLVGGKPPLPRKQSPHQKYLELLVHNVSHTDLVLGLDSLPPSAAYSRSTMSSVPEHTTTDDDDENSMSAASAGDAYSRNYIRPRFSSFDLFCRIILDNIGEGCCGSPPIPAGTIATSSSSHDMESSSSSGSIEDCDPIIYFPRYQRSMEDPRYGIRNLPMGSNPPRTPTGFKLAQAAPLPTTITTEDIRVRESEEATLLTAFQECRELIRIRHVFFPLLATILPVWHRHIQEKEYHNSTVKRVLILVTGVGTPRNRSHTANGNSTEICAQLMQYFLARVDPTLTVVRLHSNTNVFRYDENLLFCERELMPTIHAYRDAHATGAPYPDELQQSSSSSSIKQQPSDSASTTTLATTLNFDDSDWRTSMHVTLSFADGSPARTHAIQASLRSYKPTYFHFWQLKTFWHESKVVDDDIEVHSFETMETLPAIDADRVRDPALQLVVQEIRSFYQEMTTALTSGQNDIQRFWLRKTHKPVLAVLLVQSAGMKEPKLYRGTNMEVSMPTGSLCAERSAIGSALATNPNLKRQDLKLIAVLAVPPVETVLVETGTVTASNPVDGNKGTATSTSMRRIASQTSIVLEESMDNDRHMTTTGSRRSSFGSEYEASLPADEWIISDAPDANLNASIASSNGEDLLGGFDGGSGPSATSGTLTGMAAPTEPVRRIALFSRSSPAGSRPAKSSTKKTVVVLSNKDANPLAPCGACNEWLKKISESNPYFRIVTFTDANCNGIYVSPCKE